MVGAAALVAAMRRDERAPDVAAKARPMDQPQSAAARRTVAILRSSAAPVLRAGDLRPAAAE
jgi:hypothetical protein